MATIAECAAHLDMGERNLIELISRGVVERRPGRGQYDLDEVRLAYIRHLRGVAAGRKPDDGEAIPTSALDAHRERLMAARADRAELNLALERGELLPAEQVADAWQYAVGTMKQKLLAVPASIAPQAAAERDAAVIEKLCRDGITQALDELVETKVKGGRKVERADDEEADAA